jgi:hypothetical protein
MNTAIALEKHTPNPETLKKIQQNRKDLSSLQVFPATVRGG